MHLAVDDERIDQAAEIVDCGVTVNGDFAGVGIDLHLTDVTAVGKPWRLCGEVRVRLKADAKVFRQPSRMVCPFGDVPEADLAIRARNIKISFSELYIVDANLQKKLATVFAFSMISLAANLNALPPMMALPDA